MTKWDNENEQNTQTTFNFINKNGNTVSEFTFDCFTRFFSPSNNFVVIWSSDSKFRLFNAEGKLLWQHSVAVECIYDMNSISVSNDGLVAYSLENQIWKIDTKQNKSLVYELSPENHKKLTGDDLEYNNIESEIEELGTETIRAEIRSESHSRVTKYFNEKELYFIVYNNEVSVLGKDVKSLAKLIFSSTVNYLEVLEKHNKLVVTTDKRLFLFEISYK